MWYRPDNLLGLPLCVDLKLVEGGLKLRCFCVKMARSRCWLKVGLHYLVLLKWRRRQWRYDWGEGFVRNDEDGLEFNEEEDKFWFLGVLDGSGTGMGYNGSLVPFLLESRSVECSCSSSQDSASPSVISSPGNGTVFIFLNFLFFKLF